MSRTLRNSPWSFDRSNTENNIIDYLDNYGWNDAYGEQIPGNDRIEYVKDWAEKSDKNIENSLRYLPKERKKSEARNAIKSLLDLFKAEK